MSRSDLRRILIKVSWREFMQYAADIFRVVSVTMFHGDCLMDCVSCISASGCSGLCFDVLNQMLQIGFDEGLE
jgi:hypothetical protein